MWVNPLKVVAYLLGNVLWQMHLRPAFECSLCCAAAKIDFYGLIEQTYMASACSETELFAVGVPLATAYLAFSTHGVRKPLIVQHGLTVCLHGWCHGTGFVEPP
jgi:hypothetical protein